MTNHERLTLERDAAIKIRNARAALIQSRPFYAVLISQVEPKPSWQFATMATDSKTHFYNPAFICSINQPETEGTCVHESEHDGRHHSTRRNGRDPEDWNKACDYAINGDIIAQGFVLPKGFLYRADLVGLSADEIYRILQNERQHQQQQHQEEQENDDESESETNNGAGAGDSENEGTDEKSEDQDQSDQGSEDEGQDRESYSDDQDRESYSDASDEDDGGAGDDADGEDTEGSD